ncbi:hypothetical protein ACGFI3_12140 [Nonomuraea wenchangensis]|uniref:hypothetical protein n=1 Tax=Nonomuraea wenchangensis TaxID=568860 RepID=UPI003713B328
MKAASPQLARPVAAAHLWPEVFVPSPGSVWQQFLLTSSVHDGQRGYGGYLLSEHLLASLRRIALGSLYGIADVVVLGLLVIGASGLLIDTLLQSTERLLVPWRGKA